MGIFHARTLGKGHAPFLLLALRDEIGALQAAQRIRSAIIAT